MPPAGELPPMPDAVAALPRDRRGYPVPWVAEWSSGTFHVRADPVLGRVLDCSGCTPGHGRARLGVNCVERQRAGILHRRCGVCGLSVDGPLILIGEVGMPVSVEPAVHPDCGVFALRACPRLTRSLDKVGVVVADGYEVAEQRIIALDGNGRPIDRTFPIGLGALTGGLLSFLVAVLPADARSSTAADWLARHRGAW